MAKRRRVAILGGGIGGLTAALELTATPELREQYEVTVHQLGWRAGGKCATGRDAAHGDRILEHGLHLWFSGYVNAFALLKRCYDELDRPDDHPLSRIDHAWTPLAGSIMYDDHGGHWSAQQLTFPVTPGLPWDPVAVPRVWDLISEAVELVRNRPLRRLSSPRVGPIARILRRIGDAVEHRLFGLADWYANWRHDHPGTKRRHLHPASWLLSMIRWVQWRRVRPHLDDDGLRHQFTTVDLWLTTLIGLIDDNIAFEGFSTIDDEEFRAWLTRHGAREVTLGSPIVRVVYDQVFAGSTGPATTAAEPAGADRAGTASTAAGAAVYGMLRTALPGPGSVMWQARAGMGDTAIAPMYETLVARDVRFEFFHAVQELGVDHERNVVDRISIVRQAEPAGGKYDPLREVEVGSNGDRPAGTLRCWPSEPLWDRLERGDELRSAGLDFEAGDAEHGAPTIDLALGTDFDTVVLAISAAALPPICREVMAASPAFATMLEHTHTTMTQAFQIWLNTPLSDVGFPYGHAATTTYREPIDTAADNSQVLWSEHWPGGDDHASSTDSVWYFCGVLDDAPGDDDDRCRTRSHDGMVDQLRHIGGQWPGAIGHDGEFRSELLAADAGTPPEQRLAQQFWRANSTPTERYVQTPPGTVKYRLEPGKSGVDNLILAGDWTKNSFNFGAVEATVMTGMAASRAICGQPEVIQMEGHDWLTG